MDTPEYAMKEYLNEKLSNENINVKNENGETPLIIAAKNKNYHIFRKILDQKSCDIEATDNKGNNALFYVFTENVLINENYDEDVLQIIKDNLDLNLNHKNNQGQTILMLASKTPHYNTKYNNTLNFLIENTDALLVDNKGRSAFDYSVNIEIKCELAKHCPINFKELITYAYNKPLKNETTNWQLQKQSKDINNLNKIQTAIENEDNFVAKQNLAKILFIQSVAINSKQSKQEKITNLKTALCNRDLILNTKDKLRLCWFTIKTGQLRCAITIFSSMFCSKSKAQNDNQKRKIINFNGRPRSNSLQVETGISPKINKQRKPIFTNPQRINERSFELLSSPLEQKHLKVKK